MDAEEQYESRGSWVPLTSASWVLNAPRGRGERQSQEEGVYEEDRDEHPTSSSHLHHAGSGVQHGDVVQHFPQRFLQQHRKGSRISPSWTEGLRL